MLETEPAIVVQPVAVARRAILAGESTARCLAHPLLWLRAVCRHQGFRSPSRHSANMCSTVWPGKRGE